MVTVHGQKWNTRLENIAFHIADIVICGYEYILGYKFLYQIVTHHFVCKPLAARLQNIHGQCYTKGSLEDDGGRDARDPRILTFAKKYGCTQPYLNFSFRPVNGYKKW